MATKKISTEFSLEKLQEIDKDPLLSESDRGCVLIQTTDLENTLTDLLKGYFNAASNITRKQIKILFDYSGPLGTFSSKIQTAYAIGLISKEIHNDLDKIRKIRNIAAHSDSSFSLSNDKITKIVDSLNFKDSSFGVGKDYPRYSFSEDSSDEPDDKLINENVMKGYGLIRHDKAKYIFTTKSLSFEILKLKVAAKIIGKEIGKKREEILAGVENSLDSSTDGR